MKPPQSIKAGINVFAASIADVVSCLIGKAPRHFAIPMPNPNKLWFVLVLPACLSCRTFSHGTAIAIVRTDNAIVAAADSRAVDSRGNRLPDVCKIRSAGPWHFSINGAGTLNNVNVSDVVRRQIMKAPNSLTQDMTAISDVLKTLISAAMREDAALRAYALSTGAVLSVAVFGSNEDAMRLATIRFATADGSINHDIRFRPPDCGKVVGFFVPASDTRLFDWNKPPLFAVQDFLQNEIDRHQSDIGGPIQVLMISLNGKAVWVQKPPPCNDQQ